MKMITICTFFIILMSFISCESDRIVPASNIDKLIVTEDPLGLKGSPKMFTIMDKASIRHFTRKINHAKREMAEFRPFLKIEVCYLHKAKLVILCNRKRINVGGVTYKLDKNIEQLIIPAK